MDNKISSLVLELSDLKCQSLFDEKSLFNIQENLL
jgi:hypothetical protein